ncbi:MAG: protein kinase [Bradymonadaceae bacterium]|nr:protein kinase [Lujinxingiaceae bacterium]
MKPALPIVGDLIAGRYRLMRELGRGGYGVVFHARQEAIGRNVAIKFLNPHAITDKMEIERFRREVFHVSGLTHTNTITLYDYGQTAQGILYIVMEYLEGHNLRDWLAANQKMAYDEVFSVVTQVLGSLREAHQHDIVHRDLKLENIFLHRSEGGEFFAKVLDFGLSKYVGQATSTEAQVSIPLTAEGIICGTPQYMSPEHAYGEAVGPPSDVYAIGLVAYELLTGQTAFNSDSPVEVLLMQVNSPTPELPKSLRMTDLAEFIRISTRKEAKERYADAAEALEWLRHPPRRSQPIPTSTNVVRPPRPSLSPPPPPPPPPLPPLPVAATAPVAAAVVAEAAPPPVAVAAAAAPVGVPTLQGLPLIERTAQWERLPLSEVRYSELEMLLAQLPLVGRHADFEALMVWSRRAFVNGGVLWLTGELGMGKTRLLDEWLAHIRQSDNVQLLRGRYRQRGLALEGLREALVPVMEQARATSAHSPTHALNATDIAELQVVLQMQSADGSSPSYTARGRDWACARIEQSLVALAKNGPVLIVLEDLHWADSFTQRLVEHLQEDIATHNLPLAFVFTGRSEEFHDLEPIQRLSWDVQHLHLAPLTAPESMEFLSHLLPGSLPLMHHVVALGRGNPMYLVQVVRFLVDQKLVHYDDDALQWQLADASRSLTDLAPPDLAGMVLNQLQKLLVEHPDGEAIHALLVRAALIGTSFSAGLLRELVRREGRHDLEAHLAQSVNTLVNAAILAPIEVNGNLAYEFTHHLLRAALERQQPHDPQSWVTLHRIVAQLKIDFYAEVVDRSVDEIAHEIAAHFLSAEDLLASFKWWTRAASYAERAHDFRGALARYRQAEKLYNAEHDPSSDLLLSMRLSQGRLYRFLGEYGPAEDALRGARTTAREMGDQVGEALASEALADVLKLLARYDEARRLYRDVAGWYDEVPDRQGRIRCDIGLGDIARFRGSYVEAEIIFERAMRRAVDLPDSTIAIQCMLGLGRCAYAAGRLHQAQHFYEDARLAANLADHALLQIAAEIELGCVAMITQGIVAAETILTRALTKSRKVGDILGQANAHLILAITLRRSTRLAVAEGHAHRARLIFERLSHTYGLAKCILLSAELAWVRDRLDEAMIRVKDSRKLHEDLQDAHGLALSMMFQGLFEIENQQTRKALTTLQEALALGGQEGLGLYEPHCLLFMGMAYEAEQNVEEAIAYYGESLDVAERQGNREMASFSAINLAKLHIVMGDLENARNEIPVAIEQAETLGHSYATMFALVGQAWLARLNHDAPRLQVSLQKLRVLQQAPDGPQMRTTERLFRMAELVFKHQPKERATASVRAMAEILRSLGDADRADLLRLRL